MLPRSRRAARRLSCNASSQSKTPEAASWPPPAFFCYPYAKQRLTPPGAPSSSHACSASRSGTKPSSRLSPARMVGTMRMPSASRDRRGLPADRLRVGPPSPAPCGNPPPGRPAAPPQAPSGRPGPRCPAPPRSRPGTPPCKKALPCPRLLSEAPALKGQVRVRPGDDPGRQVHLHPLGLTGGPQRPRRTGPGGPGRSQTSTRGSGGSVSWKGTWVTSGGSSSRSRSASSQ